MDGGKIGGGVALEQSRDKGLGLLDASLGQQGDGVGLARLLRTGGIGGQRLQKLDGFGMTVLRDERAAIAKAGRQIAGIIGVGALVGLGGILGHALQQDAGVHQGRGGQYGLMQRLGDARLLAVILQPRVQLERLGDAVQGAARLGQTLKLLEGDAVGLGGLLAAGVLAQLGVAAHHLRLQGLHALEFAENHGGVAQLPGLDRAGEETAEHLRRHAELAHRQGQVGSLLQQFLVVGLQVDGGAKLGQGRLELALLQELLRAFDELGGVSHGC